MLVVRNYKDDIKPYTLENATLNDRSSQSLHC